MRYFIQGVFFQEQGHPAQILQTMFSGMFGTLDELEDHEGEMIDFYGESYMSYINLTPDTLTFVKVYRKRTDSIYYRFTKQSDDTWQGEYKGDWTGTGICRCVVTRVPENFFHPTLF